MKFKLVDSYKYKLAEGSSLSRIWQYTQGENKTFAIIGSQDQTTKEDRFDELLSSVQSLMRGQVDYKHPYKGPMITYIKLQGTYTYTDDESVGYERSLLINNITLNKALEIVRSINQQSIVWKDKNFFGIVDCDTGKASSRFSTDKNNMTFDPEIVQKFGSKIVSKHAEGDKGFAFKLERFVRGKGIYDTITEELFTLEATRNDFRE